MLTVGSILLVTDARAESWSATLRHSCAMPVECVRSLAALPSHVATRSAAMVCIDAALAAQNSAAFLANALSSAHLKPRTPIVLLADDAQWVERYRGHAPFAHVVLADQNGAWGAKLSEFLNQWHARSQTELLTAALEGAHSGVVVIEPRGAESCIAYANAEFARLTGYATEEVVGRSFEFLEGPDTDANSARELHEALHAGREYAGEHLHYRKDGVAFWNRLAVRPVRDAAGATQHLVVTQEDVTERRRIRERLRASEARLELAMSASGLAMWDWNVVTGEIFYNDQWHSLLEVPAEELLLRESLAERLVLPEEDVSICAEFERHLAGATPRFEREFEVRAASGKTKFVVARADVVSRDAGGQATRVIGVWRDVSSRRANQRTIEETHKRWERAVAGTSEGLFDWDLATGHVWYAPRFREQLGYGEQEFNNSFTAFQKLIHEEERVAVLAKIRGHLEQRTQLDLNCRLRCKSGDHRWFRLRGSAERDAAGRPRRLSGSIRDISGQVDAEEALHRSEHFYGTILDALPLTVAYIDREERIVYANTASAVLTGVPVELLRGSGMRSVLHPELYAQLAPPLAQAFRNETIERQIRTQDGNNQTMDVDITYLPHCDANGDVQGCFVVARNVTTRLRLEAELRQSQKMEAIGRLTGGVAHDFNNLLSVAIGNAQLLSRTLKDSPRLHKQADTILRAAMRGAELTRRLLTFARQQQSTVQVSRVNELISDMYELLRRTLPGDVELKLSLDGTGCTKLDPGQFENALLNLIINARDAMPQGGAIAVRSRHATASECAAALQEEVAPGEYVVVDVRDTGTGMSPEVARRVFEPFFTTKESGKGSGLGLAMVHSFVKSCAGYAGIRSAPGEGTQVSLYFPCAVDTTQAADERASVTPEAPRGTETILVVDVTADVRATAVEMLSSLGYRVLEAADGREALAVVATQERVDLVFSDIMLPGGVSSAALIRKLRALYPDIKALLTSGFSESVIAHRSLLDGSVEMLAKPYELTDMARRVRAVLDSPEEKTRVQAR